MKKLAIAIVLLFSSSSWATCVNTTAQVTSILSNAVVTGISINCYKFNPGTSGRYVQVLVTGTGAITSTVLLEGSTDGVNFNMLDTFTESGTTSVAESIMNNNSATYLRGNITAISGVGAAVTLNVGTGN